ncbi:hypothetical protein BJ166DRAFT_339888 [Pestalotiopsis sp. NC0098]|nr:hypothetical protein BJ166DRAFT_339888 [Pestalotiopsis sp. NC0098]
MKESNMFRAARILALTGLATSINAQYSVDSGTLKWNQSGTPYGLPESTLIDALANPIASSNYTTGALLNETDDSASSIPPSFITTVSVVELPLGANNSAAADLVIETSNYREVDVSGWEVCNTFFVFDDVKAFTDIFASTDDGSCSPFPDECVSQLQRLSCDNTQASGWPSECPETSTTMRSSNLTATSFLEADAWLSYYSRPHDVGNTTDADNLANAIIPAVQVWTTPDKRWSSTEVHCFKASKPSATATSTPTSTPSPTSSGSTTTSSSFASPTAVFQKKHLLGAAMAVGGYLVY